MTVTVAPAVPDLLGTSPADLLDAEAPVATLDEARMRAERMRVGGAFGRASAEVAGALRLAYRGRDWEPLGYESWSEYVSAEFGAAGVALAARFVPTDRDVLSDTRSVYFIQSLDGGLIKIGVAGDPVGRLAEIQRMCPVPLRIVGTLPGSGQVGERALHRRFSASRRHGEWFEPTADLLVYIEANGVRS